MTAVAYIGQTVIISREINTTTQKGIKIAERELNVTLQRQRTNDSRLSGGWIIKIEN